MLAERLCSALSTDQDLNLLRKLCPNKMSANVLLICGTIAVGAENVQADPAHSFLAAAETAPERKFWDAVLERARSCVTAKEFSPVALCFLKSTPKKCQPLVYDALLGSRNKQQWYLCVISCGDAGWYSRTFGECSRELGEQ